jgi:hypothetical protein
LSFVGINLPTLLLQERPGGQYRYTMWNRSWFRLW